MIQQSQRQFLLGKVNTIKHSGGTLYMHLQGTHDLLRAWGNDDDVCAAGFFHSIYGTNKFRTKAWPITDRETIRDLIGERAERLVYAFCTIDRPAAFFDFGHRVISNLPTDVFRDLLEIEAANLLEQGSRSKWLKRLRDSDISDAAKRAIDEHHANLSSRT